MVVKKISKFTDDKEVLNISVITSFRSVLGLEIQATDFVFKNGIILINKFYY